MIMHENNNNLYSYGIWVTSEFLTKEYYGIWDTYNGCIYNYHNKVLPLLNKYCYFTSDGYYKLYYGCKLDMHIPNYLYDRYSEDLYLTTLEQFTILADKDFLYLNPYNIPF